MQPTPISVFRSQPPPLWYVTNGELTVGPVATTLLARGVESGRVPEYCHVRAARGTWRELTGVREVAALGTKPNAKAPTEEQFSEWARPVERVRDEAELCHTITWLALIATGAESAMFHYRGRYSNDLVTRSVLGPMPNDQLNASLRPDDPVLAAARERRPVVGPPYGVAEDALAMRFATSSGGVGAAAMIPIFVAGALKGMLEISRPGHAFRRNDLVRAERIAQRALLPHAN